MADKNIEYKCPCCGGAIAFDAALQKLKCPFCDTEFEPETLKDYDEALKKDAGDEIEWNEMATEAFDNKEGEDLVVYVCENCGGEIIGTKEMAASTCPYCDSPVVISGHLAGSLKPDIVVPFKLTKEQAKERLKSFYKNKPLLPNTFADENKIDEIKGIYVPFWLYDAKTNANIRYSAENVIHWEDSRFAYTKVEHYSLLREGSLDFQNVPADGSKNMADDFMESIEPFDLSEGVDFQTAYLAGFLADKYDVTSEECKERVNARMKHSTEEAFKTTTSGYTTVNAENSSIKVSDGSIRYAFLPVWMLNTTWNGAKYTFAMNGQTGKFVGTLPIDKKKKWLNFLIATAIGAAAGFLIAFLVGKFLM